ERSDSFAEIQTRSAAKAPGAAQTKMQATASAARIPQRIMFTRKSRGNGFAPSPAGAFPARAWSASTGDRFAPCGIICIPARRPFSPRRRACRGLHPVRPPEHADACQSEEDVGQPGGGERRDEAVAAQGAEDRGEDVVEEGEADACGDAEYPA